MTAQIVGRLREYAKKYRYLLIVVAAGILLMLLPTGSKDGAQTTRVDEPEYETFELDAFERRVEAALEKMAGVGETEVVLTLKNTMSAVYQTDLRSTQRGEQSDVQYDTVVVNTGSGVQKAVVASRSYPQFQGALVVCDGGGNAAVRLEVTRAVSALTGLSSDRITVVRRGD